MQYAIVPNPIFMRITFVEFSNKMVTSSSGWCFVKGLAVGRYASDYPPATICALLELNSLFQCTRNVEVPAMTRLSLLVAATQVVFTLAGIRLVALLRKVQKPSTTTSETISGDDDLCSVVRKLRNEFREGQAQLRTNS